MLNKDAGFQSATSLKTKLLYKYFSKLLPKFLEEVLNRTLSEPAAELKYWNSYL